MNYRALLKLFYFSRPALWLFFLFITPCALASFPWKGTFSGINAEPSLSQNAPSGPFQTPSTPSNGNQNDNPFFTPASDISRTTTQKTSSSIAQLLASPASTLSQKANAAFTTSTSIGGASLKITPQTKLRTTPVANALGNLMNVSFTQVQKEIRQPQQPLFLKHPTVAAAYQDFMNALQTTPNFLPLFKKIHLMALHQMYMYLTGIYTALNMTHIDDVKSYMITEKKYALNKKTLIINHLLALIMAQLNQELRALMPGLPENYALNAGMACVQSDKISDPQIFILDMEKSVLAVLGLEKLEPFQITATYLALQKYIPLLKIQVTPDLTAAMNKLATTSFSAKHLSEGQGQALVAALHQIIAYFTERQTTARYQTIISFLDSENASTVPSALVVALAQKFMEQLVYGQPLAAEIAFCKEFAKLLTAKNAPSLTTSQVTMLKGIIGYILERYETAATKQISQIIQILGELNPTHEVLSPSQSLALASLSKAMLTKKNPLLLDNLSDQQRSLLAYGLWIASKNQTVLKDTQAALTSLAEELKKHPVTQNSLSLKQASALQTAATAFSTYTLAPLSVEGFKTTAQQKLTQLNPQLTESEQEAIITEALHTINSGTFTSFDQLTSEEQIILLELFQLVDQVLETRMQNHRKESTELSYLFAGDTVTQNALFSSINATTYEILQKLSAVLAQTTGALSLQTLLKGVASAAANPQETLLKIFTVPETSSGKQRVNGTSYLSLLVAMQKQHFQNKALLAIISQLTPEQIDDYKQALKLFASSHFSFSELPKNTRTSLAKTVSDYLAVRKTIPLQSGSGPSGLSDPNESALETVANVVQYTQQNTTMRSGFLWTLNRYLVFFNSYAQLLETTTSDDDNPAYLGLSEFAAAAGAIQKQLAYDADSNDGLARLIEQTNPPLFFYDKTSFRALRLLPKLAASVKNSSIAPYPTFGIEQAVSSNGSIVDPLTGQTVTNTTTLGPTFSYQKFFFLEASDPTKEITGRLPSWIKPVTIAHSKGKTTTLYEPGDIPQDGITGFYMNLPTFQQNPLSTKSALIRLYEQPIIAQPAWLNRSGLEKKPPLPGVITMLRGCVGDFQAVLDLNIFDPCLTIIFKKALATTENTTAHDSVGFTAQEGKRCAAYIAEKSALLKQQENPVATVSDTSLAEGGS